MTPFSKRPRVSFAKIKTIPRRARTWKVQRKHFGAAPLPGATVAELLDTLPGVLAADDLRATIAALANAQRRRRPVLALVGAHVIKCGLTPILCDLLRRRVITAIAMNGAGAIHDFELARWGATSENVDETLVEGTFGLVDETGREMNALFADGFARSLGMGETLGEGLVARNARYASESLLATAYAEGIPATVHVALGTDVIHQHPTARGDVIGALTMEDFRLLAGVVSTLASGSVVLNLGSAVVLPEVFLKCVSSARNLGFAVSGFTAVNVDMIQHYRPRENVLRRPTIGGGRAIALTGHHEIMIPLLAAGVIDKIATLPEKTRARRKGKSPAKRAP
ncbi:MAG: hypothetical protein ACKVU1_08715 [bacterium]